MLLLVDVATLGRVSVEPEVVGVDIRTWIVNEVPVQVYVHAEYSNHYSQYTAQ